jgi:hypothetical protein
MLTVNDVHHRLDLDESKQAAYDAWTSTFTQARNPKAQNFQILARKLGIDPHFAIHNWFDPASPLSPKTSKIINILQEWSDGNQMSGPEFDHLDLSSRPMKPVEDQTKMVIHTHWTSQMPVLLNRLAQNGFFAKFITGDTPPHTPQAIVTDFQSDQDHLSDPAGWVPGDNMVEFYPPRPCRIIIITSVGAAGINLLRANHLILVDLFFTHQERVQVVGAGGRVARKGQSRACQIHTISVHKTCDDWLTGLAGSKGMAASALFGNNGSVVAHYEAGTAVGADSNPLALPASLVASLQTTEATRRQRGAVKKARDLNRRLETPKIPAPKFSHRKEEVDERVSQMSDEDSEEDQKSVDAPASPTLGGKRARSEDMLSGSSSKRLREDETGREMEGGEVERARRENAAEVEADKDIM